MVWKMEINEVAFYCLSERSIIMIFGSWPYLKVYGWVSCRKHYLFPSHFIELEVLIEHTFQLKHIRQINETTLK